MLKRIPSKISAHSLTYMHDYRYLAAATYGNIINLYNFLDLDSVMNTKSKHTH
jgi:hypothetical protein